MRPPELDLDDIEGDMDGWFPLSEFRDLVLSLVADSRKSRADRDLFAQALWDAWAATGQDTDGDTGPGAWITGSGAEAFAKCVVDDVTEYRRQSDADYDSDIAKLTAERDKMLPMWTAAEAWREGQATILDLISAADPDIASVDGEDTA